MVALIPSHHPEAAEYLMAGAQSGWGSEEDVIVKLSVAMGSTNVHLILGLFFHQEMELTVRVL